MLVEVWHWIPGNDDDHREYYTISIKGVFHEQFLDIKKYKKYNTNLISDYIDTVVDFMKEFCPDFSIYFEYYDNNEVNLGEGKELEKNKEVVQTVFTFIKK